LQASYESQYSAYRTWLDEDARTGLILVASMEDQFSAEIVELGRSNQMWTFLRSHYEPIRQYTFIVAIHQEQLLHQGDDIVDAFFDQLSAIWHENDTLGPQLSPATYQSCKDQKAALELRHTYNFLTCLRDEFEPLHAHLLARHPCVSLMDALVEVHNEETRLQDAGLLWVFQSWLHVLRLLILLLPFHRPLLRFLCLLLVV
jgi:hypothetical protein